MTAPLYLVLIVAVWAWALAVAWRDFHEDEIASGLKAAAVCAMAIIGTLAILLAHSMWGVP